MEGIVKLEEQFYLRYCIWGTGKYGRLFVNKIIEYNEVFQKIFHIDLSEYIKYFIDSDIKKQNQKMFNKPIKSPAYFYKDNIDICVFATSRVKEIKTDIQMSGCKKDICYITWRQVINEYKKVLLRRRNEILDNYNFDKIEALDFRELLSCVKKKMELFNTEVETSSILENIFFSLLIERWEVSDNKEINFLRLRECFDDAFIVAAFAWYYGDNITKIGEWFSTNIKLKAPYVNKAQTIGMVVDRYFGGGIEKAVSILLTLFVSNGHKVVLITDKCKAEVEYDIPQGVIRYVMNNAAEDNLLGRINELYACAIENRIDIMCFHSGYQRIDTFYEMLMLKLQNIAVLMEVHSAFLALITEHKDVSDSFSYMYKMANRLIVLSDVDKLFWENLGCNCTYIQNPVEDCVKQNNSINKENNNCKIIVWIGRLVQTPKRVFDTILIIKEVVKRFPCIKLKIFGSPDEQRVYYELIKRIEECNLENNIELCGYTSDINEIYNEAEIVLMTSSSESFSNVIMESKIRGIPIVMYKLPWLELLKSKKGYMAVEQGDTYAAAAEIVKLLNNDDLRMQMAVDARKSIEPFINHDVYTDWKWVFDNITEERSKESLVSNEFAFIEKMLLDAFYNGYE